ncbi:MAG: hypothetical protein ACREE9_18025 [Stellaceae bacterium]
MSPEKMYLAWRKRREIGCVFAQIIARHPDRFEQRIDVISGQLSADELAASIAARCDRLIADAATAAATILLPDILTLEDAARTFLALSDQPGWGVTTTSIQNQPAERFVAIHIVKMIPFGTTTCPSEALVLGPFDEFPPTRRAPITALEIYVGDPRPFDPKIPGKPTTKANLAHIEMNLPTHVAFEKIWAMSEKGRRLSLGGDDSRAKAKISLALPYDLAQQLGCLP